MDFMDGGYSLVRNTKAKRRHELINFKEHMGKLIPPDSSEIDTKLRNCWLNLQIPQKRLFKIRIFLLI